MWIRKGVRLIEEEEGEGPEVLRQHSYVVAIRVSLNRGDIITEPKKCLSYSVDSNLEALEEGILQHRVRIDREHLIPGVFYAVQGMKVGGYRKVVISPHLGYGAKGIPGVVPPDAKLTVEIWVKREA